jgi:hypothetical protein
LPISSILPGRLLRNPAILPGSCWNQVMTLPPRDQGRVRALDLVDGPDHEALDLRPHPVDDVAERLGVVVGVDQAGREPGDGDDDQADRVQRQDQVERGLDDGHRLRDCLPHLDDRHDRAEAHGQGGEDRGVFPDEVEQRDDDVGGGLDRLLDLAERLLRLGDGGRGVLSHPVGQAGQVRQVLDGEVTEGVTEDVLEPGDGAAEPAAGGLGGAAELRAQLPQDELLRAHRVAALDHRGDLVLLRRRERHPDPLQSGDALNGVVQRLADLDGGACRSVPSAVDRFRAAFVPWVKMSLPLPASLRTLVNVE